LHAERLRDKSRKAVQRVRTEWLRCDDLSAGIIKAWVTVGEISSGAVTTRVFTKDGSRPERRTLYIEKPTYIVLSDDGYVDLFSLSKPSLEACAEILRDIGGAVDTMVPQLADFNDSAMLERTVVYNPQRRTYTQTTHDEPISKQALLQAVKERKVELQSYVLKVGEGIGRGGISVGSIGLCGTRWDFYLGRKSTQLTEENELTWATDVSVFLNGFFYRSWSSPISLVAESV